MRHWYPFLAATVLLLPLGGCQSPTKQAAQSNPEKAIAYYESVLRQYPGRYPARVQLAQALLRKAEATLDPIYVQRARRELNLALDRQPTLEGFLAMAKIQAFAHQFDDCIRWAQQAAQASPTGKPTPHIQAILLEAYLALDQPQLARQQLPLPGSPLTDLHQAAAQGVFLMSQKLWTEAASAFAQAALLAERQNQPHWIQWALVQEAGCFLDAGMLEPGRAQLEDASSLDPANPQLLLHWAEYHADAGQPRLAYNILKGLLRAQDNPAVHHQAYSLAVRLNLPKDAQHHCQAAEQGYRKAIDAGEVYTLGALARLYTEARIHPDQALELARKNLQFVRDAQARETLDQCLAANGESNATPTP